MNSKKIIYFNNHAIFYFKIMYILKNLKMIAQILGNIILEFGKSYFVNIINKIKKIF